MFVLLTYLQVLAQPKTTIQREGGGGVVEKWGRGISRAPENQEEDGSVVGGVTAPEQQQHTQTRKEEAKTMPAFCLPLLMALSEGII